jgi:plastocyanin
VLLPLALLGAALLAGPTVAAGHSVHIVDDAFTPTTITVHVGDTVTWTNVGYYTHNVTGAGLHSSDINPGRTYQHKFTAVGTYKYECSIHYFTGKVVVIGANPTPRPTPKPTPKPTPNPTAKPVATPAPTAKPTANPKPAASPTPSPSSSATDATGPATSATAAPAVGLAASPASSGSAGGPVPSPTTDPTASGGPPGLVLVLLALVIVLGGAGLFVRARR